MIILKKGVKLTGLKDEMHVVWQNMNELYNRIDRDCVITSGVDGKHSKNSRHYSGNALDFRIRHLYNGEDYEVTEEDLQIAGDIVASVKSALGEGYFVLLEKTHIHIEYRGFY